MIAAVAHVTLDEMAISRLKPALIAIAALLLTFFAQDQSRQLNLGELFKIPAPPQYIGVTVDPKVIRRLLGLRVVAADLIWIDAMIKADNAHESAAFTGLYRAFKAASELDPDNFQLHYVAGLYLSVIKNDVRGATVILREGAKRLESRGYSWDKSWQLLFALGYNLIFEEEEVEEGGRWITKAAELPNAPGHVKSLAAHVSTERGRLEVAAGVLNDMYRRTKNPEDRQRIEQKMIAITANQDLLELNEKFQAFLKQTGAYAFPRKRQLQVFLHSHHHPGVDLLKRKIVIDKTGRLSVSGADGAK